jgi:SAM-dependent methyltransferase
MSNVYEDPSELEVRVRGGDHRGVVGGLWDEIGTWQFEFCRSQGLLPSHQFIDIGCGSLRGGVHFVRYLEPGHYAGVDTHDALLDAGYERELVPSGLAPRLDRARLKATSRFEFGSFGQPFDMALAQSVFTHVPFNQIRLCLSQLAQAMQPGGRFFATYFEIGEDVPLDAAVDRGGGIVTRYDANPYHYTFSDLQRAAEGLPVIVRRIGEAGHPRGQFVAEFLFTGAGDSVRQLSASDALALPAGAGHYRAYVGPPQRFDFMSSTQFALLHTFGLREEDSMLDVGCGSLRLGRLLIPFLQPGRYCGVDPNAWLIEEGIRRELGADAVRLKQPSFATNSDFDFSTFGRQFDFVIAQSIATHTGPDMLDQLIAGAASVIADEGLFLFSYIREPGASAPPAGWHYPECVGYDADNMIARLREAGLVAREIPWFHPAASWITAARNIQALPSESDLAALSGAVLARPSDRKGYAPAR